MVDDPAVKHLLREKAGAQPLIVEEAPVVLVLCATEETDFVMPCGECSAPIDMALCGAYTPRPTRAGPGECAGWGAFDAQAVKDVLQIPPQARVITMMPLATTTEPSPANPASPWTKLWGITVIERRGRFTGPTGHE
ncbi:MAG: hypothetical protein V8R55_06900 [Dysosmobacter sp.]